MVKFFNRSYFEDRVEVLTESIGEIAEEMLLFIIVQSLEL